MIVQIAGILLISIGIVMIGYALSLAGCSLPFRSKK